MADSVRHMADEQISMGSRNLFCPRCGERYPAGEEKCARHDDRLLPVGTGESRSGEILKGKYLLLETVGKGGFGAVFKARHLVARALVAVKLLHADKAEKENTRKQFLKEARALMHLRSRNIVIVHDVDETEDGQLFIVMELLRGMGLNQYLSARAPEDRRLGASAGAHLMVQVCQALQEAHSLGVVHRDLKPENIFVNTDATGREVIKVVDFGIAKLHEDLAGTLATAANLEGAIIGTPAYMAPEQARGLKVDARTDIYSLGAMLFELLTGQRPFQSETSQGLLIAHVTEAPPHIAEAFPELGLPEGLAELVHQMLAKEPDDRPATAADVAARLAAFTGAGVDAPGSAAGDNENLTPLMSSTPNRSNAAYEPTMASDQGTATGGLSTTIDMPLRARPGVSRAVMAAAGVVLLLGVAAAAMLVGSPSKPVNEPEQIEAPATETTAATESPAPGKKKPQQPKTAQKTQQPEREARPGGAAQPAEAAPTPQPPAEGDAPATENVKSVPEPDAAKEDHARKPKAKKPARTTKTEQVKKRKKRPAKTASQPARQAPSAATERTKEPAPPTPKQVKPEAAEEKSPASIAEDLESSAPRPARPKGPAGKVRSGAKSAFDELYNR
jgi:eukaryotic-like serine/threonine-protein kinase